MLSSRMPELLAAEKRLGLHYKRVQKCFIDSAILPPPLAPISSPNPTRTAKARLGAKGPVNVMIREPMVGHRVDSTGPGDGKPPATLRMSWTKEGGCWMSILYHSNLNTGELVVLAVAEACSGEVNSAWNINQGLEHCSSGLCSDKGVGLRQKICSVRPGPRPLHFGGCHPWQYRG